MEPYTEIFDKRPLTYLGPDENNELVVSWYDTAIYFTQRTEYEYPMTTGNLASGSELLDKPERFAFASESGVHWGALENTGSIAIHKFTDTGQFIARFDGTFPTLCWNAHVKESNLDMLCFYLGASGIEGRSSQDDFSFKFDVFVDSDITALDGLQEISDFTGRLSVLGKYQNVSGIILTNLGD